MAAGRERRVLLVSACLCGVSCRFDGGHNLRPAVRALADRCQLVPVCPEQLGGLATPRRRAELLGGSGEQVLDGLARVVTQAEALPPVAGSRPSRSGDAEPCGGMPDVTEAFVRGAVHTVMIARLVGAGGAVLKARSPSCGVSGVYDGTFSGRLREGCGVTAAALRRAGLGLWSEDELEGVDAASGGSAGGEEASP